MINNFEKALQKQKERIVDLEKLLTADQTLIDAQKQQIRVLYEKIALLEKENLALTNAGNEMSAAYEKLEEICKEQQTLLSSFAEIFPGQ